MSASFKFFHEKAGLFTSISTGKPEEIMEYWAPKDMDRASASFTEPFKCALIGALGEAA